MKKILLFFCFILNISVFNLASGDFTMGDFQQCVSWPCKEYADCDMTPKEEPTEVTLKIKSFSDNVYTKIGLGTLVTAGVIAAGVIIYRRIKQKNNLGQK